MKSSFNVKAYVHVCLEKYDIRSFFFLKNVVIVSDPERGQVQAIKHLSTELQGRLPKLIGLLRLDMYFIILHFILSAFFTH